MALTLIAAGWLACWWLTTHLILRWWQRDFPVDGGVLASAVTVGAMGPLGLVVAALINLPEPPERVPSGLLRFFAIRNNDGR